MKLYGRLAAMFAGVAVCTLHAAPASDWHFLTSTSIDGANFRVYADLASRRERPGGGRTMWIKYVFPAGSRTHLSEMTKLIEFDCDGERLRRLGGSDYGQDGSPTGRIRGPDRWEYVEPDTAGAAEMAVACRPTVAGRPSRLRQ